MASSVIPPDTADSSTRCWELAVKIFNTTLTSDPKKIIYASRTNPSYVSSAYTEIQEEATKCIQDGLGDRSEFRKTMESSLLTFNQYATSIDVLVQHQPHVTALIWGAIRTLIQVAAKQITTSETIANAVGKIVQNIGRWDEYLRIFDTSDRVQTIAARLFAQIINYLIRATAFYTAPLTKQYFKAAITTAPSKLQDIWTDLDTLSTQLERETTLAAEEKHKTSRENFLAHTAAVKEETIKQETYRTDSLMSIKALTFTQSEVVKAVHELKLADEAHHTAEDLRRKAMQLANDRHRIMSWLHKARNYNPCSRPWEPGTAEWILKHTVYNDWENNRNGKALWIYGMPGSGKSVLAAYLAHNPQTRINIAHFLQAAVNENSTKIVAVVASILVQLLSDESIASDSYISSTLIANTLPLLDRFSSYEACPFDKLWTVVQSIYDDIPPFTLIIDALDECYATEDATNLVRKLMHMSHLPQARVIIFSRHHASLQIMLSECAQIEMNESTIRSDINLFIEREVHRTPRIRVPVSEIIERADTAARGMFLWAKLMLQYVQQASTTNMQRSRLRKFPVGLTKVYDQILSEAGTKMEPDQCLDRKRIFMLLVAATSPLLAMDIAIALALDAADMHPHADDLLIDAEETIGALCWPFTKTVGGRVQFVHYSMQEHFLMETTSTSSQGSATPLRFSSQECNNYMALACMFRLINEEARSIKVIEPLLRKRFGDQDSAASPNSLPCHWPFYQYAVDNWYVHVVKSANTFSLLQHVSRFLKGLDFIAWVEEFHTGKRNMGAVVEVQATLSSWHAGLREKQRDLIPISGFMEKPFKDFCALESVLKNTPEITYMAMHRLGLYQNTSGTVPDGSELCSIVAKGFSATLGHNNPLTLKCITRWCIERIIAPTRQLPADEALLMQTMSLQLQILGPESPDSYYTQQIAGLAMYYRAHFPGALLHLGQSCDGLLRTLGPDAEYYQHSRLYYAHALTGLERFEDATYIYEKIWRHCAQLHGSQHPLCSMTRCNLGLVYRKLRNYRLAEEHLVASLAERQRMFRNHAVIFDSYIQIALLHRDQQDADAARAYLDLAEAELSGLGFERYVQVEHMRALLCLDSGDRVYACVVLEALLTEGTKHPRNRNILWAHLTLAGLLRERGYNQKASSLFTKLAEQAAAGVRSRERGSAKADLATAEKALRMARDGGLEAAEAELRRHNLQWRSPEAFWIIFGGPAAEIY
ncbi:unnamed protein product [Alternaria alternata]